MNHNSGYRTTGVAYYAVRNQTGNAWGPGISANTFHYTFPFSFAGVANPRYRQQIVEFKDAGTNYTAWRSRVLQYAPLEAQALLKYSASEWYSTYVLNGASMMAVTPTVASTEDFSSVDDVARAKFYRKMSTDFSAGTFMGELREAITMIRRPALALRKGADAYLRTAVKRRHRVVRDARAKGYSPKAVERKYREMASATWLEVNFGWLPLYSDIVAGLEAFRDLMSAPAITPFSAMHQTRRNVPRKLMTNSGVMSINTETYLSASHQTQVRYKGAVYSQLSCSADLTQGFKLDYADAVVTGYQLLPYSWLLDYIVNVGDVLDAWVTAQRLRYVYCCRTDRYMSNYHADMQPKLVNGVAQIMDPGVLKIRVEKTQRTVVNAIPIPPLMFQHKINASQGTNIMTLAHLKAEGEAFRRRLL